MKPEIINLIFKDPQLSCEDLEKKYPPRKTISKDVLITRQAPSPTGFAHFGFIYAALAARKIADSTNGIFYLRIEDTDKEREIKDGVSTLINAVKDFGIKIDEGPIGENNSDVGEYGPYIQSKRKEIYQAFAKRLLEENKAYPCFCTKEELDEIRKIQTEKKIIPGYYGDWAKWKNKSEEEVLEKLKQNVPFVLRFKSSPSEDKKIVVKDAIGGEISFPINILEDFVILKSDGYPTYHFAHVIDDHLMGTNLVLRSTEWISSLPKHIQLFEALGFYIPTYAHIAPIEKMDGSTRRKLSKRKDDEANVYNYLAQGYETEAVKAYLLNLLTPEYDEYILNKNFVYDPNFKLSLDKLKGGSGALLDLQKLDDYSANYIANLSPIEAYEKILIWSNKYNKEIYNIFSKNKEYTLSVLSIERGTDTPRKDIKKWNDLYESVGFMFEEIYNKIDFDLESINHIEKSLAINILQEVLSTYNREDTKEVWLEKLKMIAKENGFAIDRKELKNEPQKFKGFWADIPALIRVSLAKKNKSPDLYEVMKVLNQQIEARSNLLIENLS